MEKTVNEEHLLRTSTETVGHMSMAVLVVRDPVRLSGKRALCRTVPPTSPVIRRFLYCMAMREARRSMTVAPSRTGSQGLVIFLLHAVAHLMQFSAACDTHRASAL